MNTNNKSILIAILLSLSITAYADDNSSGCKGNCTTGSTSYYNENNNSNYSNNVNTNNNSNTNNNQNSNSNINMNDAYAVAHGGDSSSSSTSSSSSNAYGGTSNATGGSSSSTSSSGGSSSSSYSGGNNQTVNVINLPTIPLGYEQIGEVGGSVASVGIVAYGGQGGGGIAAGITIPIHDGQFAHAKAQAVKLQEIKTNIAKIQMLSVCEQVKRQGIVIPACAELYNEMHR